jgi:hypothetical protein
MYSITIYNIRCYLNQYYPDDTSNEVKGINLNVEGIIRNMEEYETRPIAFNVEEDYILYSFAYIIFATEVCKRSRGERNKVECALCECTARTSRHLIYISIALQYYSFFYYDKENQSIIMLKVFNKRSYTLFIW